MIRKPKKGSRWSRDEMLLVFNLYFKLPYGKMDHRNPEVRELASIMGRTDNSIAMRLNNLHLVTLYSDSVASSLWMATKNYVKHIGMNFLKTEKVWSLRVKGFWQNTKTRL